MTTQSEREKKKAKRLKKTCIKVMLLCTYAGLWLGASWLRNGQDLMAVVNQLFSDYFSIFPVDVDFIIHFSHWPGALLLAPTQPGWVLAAVMAGGLFCLSEYTTYLINRNTRPGEEHGSAQFNTDYKGFLRGYVMSPSVLMKTHHEELKRVERRYGLRSRKYHHAMNNGKRMCKTVKASGGRRISARKRFTNKEFAACLMACQIYSKSVALSLDTFFTRLNLNAIVFGGSGAGKSRFFVEPNLLQVNSSFVTTDPSGELLMKCGHVLEMNGYVIKILNIERMDESMRYNPFAYVYEDADIPVMVDALISNIEGPKKGGSGDNKFWDETSRTLLIAICGYVYETQPPERRNFNNVIKLIDMMDVSDDRQQAEDELDKLFNDLELANPSSYAVSNYKVIKSAGTGKTAQNIVISTLAIFARFFKLDKIANLTYRDELHLEEIGQKKCALFIITPQGDTTYNFLASELYTQLFQILYRQGEQNARDRKRTSVAVDVPVRCLIDEAANIGVIPHLPEKVSTMRKYGISIALIYQNQAQIKALMKDDWETIVGNCDTMLFLGGIDASTVKTVSERLGKGTINTKHESINKGRHGGGSTSIQSTGRELMTTTEIEQMRNDQCIVFIRSMKPFLDQKYPLEQHPNYKYTGDADPKYFYHPSCKLTLDRSLMASLNIKRVGEEGYTPPERVKWASDDEIEIARRDQALRRANAQQAKKKTVQIVQQNAAKTPEEAGADALTEEMRRFVMAAQKNTNHAVMDEKEKERVRQMLESKSIGLGLHEENKLLSLSPEAADAIIQFKEGFDPTLEFEDV